MKFVIAFIVFVAFIASLGVALAQQEERLTLTTYYPAPYGAYTRLRVNGDNDPNTPDLEIGGTGSNATITVNGSNLVGLSNAIRISSPGATVPKIAIAPLISFQETGRAILFMDVHAIVSLPGPRTIYFYLYVDGAQVTPSSGSEYWAYHGGSFGVVSFSRILQIQKGTHTIEFRGAAIEGTATIIAGPVMDVLVFRN